MSADGRVVSAEMVNGFGQGKVLSGLLFTCGVLSYLQAAFHLDRLVSSRPTWMTALSADPLTRCSRLEIS